MSRMNGKKTYTHTLSANIKRGGGGSEMNGNFGKLLIIVYIFEPSLSYIHKQRAGLRSHDAPRKIASGKGSSDWPRQIDASQSFFLFNLKIASFGTNNS